MDNLEGIRAKIAKVINGGYALHSIRQGIGVLTQIKSNGELADQILSLPVSSGGGVCGYCYGSGSENYMGPRNPDCRVCNGTGRTKVVEKTLGEIIKEAMKDE